MGHGGPTETAAGVHVSSREAERTTSVDALRRCEAGGLSGDEADLKVERYRIQIILKDPIAQRPVAFLGEKDVAAFRDRHVKAGWRKKVDAAALRLTREGAPKKRLDELKGLVRRRKAAVAEQDVEQRRPIEAEIAEVEKREGIKSPARTTIVDVVRLISRSLNHVPQTMDSVLEIRSVRMPKVSPGRERRPAAASSQRRRSFLEEFLRRGIALGMLRTHRHVAEAAIVQDTADRALTQVDLALLGDDPLQVHAAPANDAIDLQIGASLDDRVQIRQLILAQPRWTTAPGLVDQTRRALCVEPVHPVAQRLPVHAGRRRGIRARLPVHHERDRQKAPSLGHVPALTRHPTQLLSALVLACDRDRHVQPPIQKATSESKIQPRVQESQEFRRSV